MSEKLLEIKDLEVIYQTDEETVHAVNGISFDLNAGESIGIVGETGAGKTTTALSILRLLPEKTGIVKAGSITMDGDNLLEVPEVELRDIYRGERTCPSGAKDGRTDRLKALMSDIDENYADYDLTAAAKFMNMNSSYFSRLFHAVTGISFNRYLTYVRCANAVNMIKSDKDLTMTEIALACGFTTIRNFNRIFRAYTGYAPTRLPDGYVMQENFIPVSASENNPTLNECILLERSDG